MSQSTPTPSEAEQVADLYFAGLRMMGFAFEPQAEREAEQMLTVHITRALRAREQAVAKACAETAEKQVCAHDCERDYTGRHSAFCAHGIATAIRTRFGVEG